ncbi:DUF1343 domain-containing protein [Planococcus sp. N028]|uniref:DUF1343 domain-containing protein n=1 Tax=Planococcus shixiaomingii TaxID=3058393 RepID=A0ABT8N4Z3_9BACL|nr:exo-beta-N-acetylmuramidase NamZ domain-containing protein [Planococcus sp. N028]MDN7242956.1 DUF1343 domain-containing protein [Planococcus sp. N028]
MGLHIVKTLYDMYPGQVTVTPFFNNLIGNAWISEGIKNGMTVEEMKDHWEAELEEFKKVRKDYLLY